MKILRCYPQKQHAHREVLVLIVNLMLYCFWCCTSWISTWVPTLRQVWNCVLHFPSHRHWFLELLITGTSLETELLGTSKRQWCFHLLGLQWASWATGISKRGSSRPVLPLIYSLGLDRELEAKCPFGDTDFPQHGVGMQGSCLSLVLQLVPDPGFQVPCDNMTTVSTVETSMESQAAVIQSKPCRSF